MINPAKVIMFMQSHPGLMNMLVKMPKFEDGTLSLLGEFLERALREDSPETFVRRALRAAIDAPREVRAVVVTQVPNK